MNRRAGYTLVELVIALPTVAILTLGMASAVLITARSIPQPGSTMTAATEAAKAFERLDRELRTATKILATNSTSVRFRVPDCNGDGQPDVISYWWEGQSGQPLYRRLNQGTAEIVMGQVSSFSLAFQTLERNTQVLHTESLTSSEQLLASFDGWPSVIPSVETFEVDSKNWIGTTFQLLDTIPRNVAQVQFTRCDVVAQRGLLSGASDIGIFRIDNGVPRPLQIGSSASIPANLLPNSWNWVETNLPNDNVVSDGSRTFAIVVSSSALLSSLKVQYLKSSSAPADVFPTMRWTTDGGSKWEPASNLHHQDLRFRIYGKYTTTTINKNTQTTKHYQSVQVGLHSASHLGVVFDSTIGLLNQPEVK